MCVNGRPADDGKSCEPGQSHGAGIRSGRGHCDDGSPDAGLASLKEFTVVMIDDRLEVAAASVG